LDVKTVQMRPFNEKCDERVIIERLRWVLTVDDDDA